MAGQTLNPLPPLHLGDDGSVGAAIVLAPNVDLLRCHVPSPLAADAAQRAVGHAGGDVSVALAGLLTCAVDSQAVGNRRRAFDYLDAATHLLHSATWCPTDERTQP